MTDEQLFVPSTSSSLFDIYLIYGIIGLLLFIAFIGLIVLLITPCCYFSTPSCYFCCCHNRRHSSYKLNKRSKQHDDLTNIETKKITFIRRYPSDVTDFSQLYDSCPHLINSKAMIQTGINISNMDTSCTTINTRVSPISPCSSFIESRSPSKRNDLNHSPQPNNIIIDKSDKATSSSAKGVCSRPFAYIKNNNDRTQNARRFTSHDRSISPAVVSIDITRISSSDSDNKNRINSPCANIYETVNPTPVNIPSPDISTPIYETDWTHNLKQIMMHRTPSMGNNGVSIIELPLSPPDLISSTDYFQQQYPYDQFLANRTKTSHATRRENMLRRLKDDAAFLY